MRLTRHAALTADAKGFGQGKVLQAALYPQLTYPSRKVVGQVRHIRDGIVAIVDPATGTVVTCYAHKVETPLRADQQDADAQAHAARVAKRQANDARKARKRDRDRQDRLDRKGRKG